MNRSLRAKLLLLCLVSAAIPAGLLFLVGRGMLTDLAELSINPEMRRSLAQAVETGERLRAEYEGNAVREALELAGDPSLARLIARRDAPALCPRIEALAKTERLDLVEVHDPAGGVVCAVRAGRMAPLPPGTAARALAKGTFEVLRGANAPDDIVVAAAVRDESGMVAGLLVVGRRHDTGVFRSVSQVADSAAAYDRLLAGREALLRRYVFALAAAGLFLVLAAVAIALFLGRTITRPARELAAAAEAVGRGEPVPRVPTRSRDELGTLADAFNKMAAAVRTQREAIASQKHFIETVLREVPTGIVALDSEGRLVAANRAAEELLGARVPALPAPPPAGTAGDAVARSAAAARTRGTVVEEEFVVRVGARERRVKLRAAALAPGAVSAPAVVAVLEDLTELIEAQRLAAWREVAQRIAHEIKNPLTPIALSAQHLLSEWEAYGKGARSNGRGFDAALRESLRTISEEAGSLRRMVEEFSLFARLPRPRREPTDLSETARGVARLYELGREGLRIGVDVPDSCVADVDPDQMRRALINLCENAVQAMPRGGELSLVVRAVGDHVEVRIADTGEGIAPDVLPRVFTPYYSTKARGSGLGLAIVHRIATDHGGSVSVESEVGRGTVFCFRVPFAGAAEPAAEGA